MSSGKATLATELGKLKSTSVTKGYWQKNHRDGNTHKSDRKWSSWRWMGWMTGWMEKVSYIQFHIFRQTRLFPDALQWQSNAGPSIFLFKELLFFLTGEWSQVSCQHWLVKSDAYKLLKEAPLWQSHLWRDDWVAQWSELFPSQLSSFSLLTPFT